MPPVPRREMLDVVKYYLERFKTDPQVKTMAKERPGTAYEMAQAKGEPYTLAMNKRIPHILDLDTGTLKSGSPGQYHYTLMEEKGISAKTPNVFVVESPKHVTWDYTHGVEMTPERIEQTIKTLQSRFQKPVVDPVTGKVFAMSGGTAAGLGVATSAEAMHEQSQTIERDGKYYNISGITGQS